MLVEGFTGFVDVVLLAEDFFDFAKELGIFPTRELDIIELDLLAAGLLR